MKFIVDTERKTIKAQSIKFSVQLPQDQDDFWKDLENKARDSLYSSTAIIDELRYNKGRLEFGHTQTELGIPKDFTCYFYLDFTDYKLYSNSGTLIKPEIITHNLRNLKVIPLEGEDWLSYFYRYWKRLAYGSSSRIKAKYLFTLTEIQLRNLKAVEKLYRAGYVVSDSRINYSLHNPSAHDKSPWDILGVPKCIFKALVQHPDVRDDISSWSAGLEKMRKFKYWGEVWSVLEELNIVGAFLREVADRSDFVTTLEELVEDKLYNRKRLLEYLFVDLPEKQGFGNITQAAKDLLDYAGMCAAVYDSIEDRYPKYLKTEHDIIIKKFNDMKKVLDNEKFLKSYEKEDLSFRSKTYYDTYGDEDDGYSRGYYRIVVPNSADSVVDEGKAMHHCVGSYIPRIQEGKCLILFMRSYEPVTSWRPKMRRHLTIELVDGVIVQARGRFNENPNENEIRCLAEYCQVRGFELSEYLKHLYKSLTREEFCLSKEEQRKDEVAC